MKIIKYPHRLMTRVVAAVAATAVTTTAAVRLWITVDS